MGELDPALVLTGLRLAFLRRGSTVEDTGDWGFSFRHGRPALLVGRVWIERVGEGCRVRYEVKGTAFERAISVLFLVLGLPTVVLSLFCLWSLLAYPKDFVEARVSRVVVALSKARTDRTA